MDGASNRPFDPCRLYAMGCRVILESREASPTARIVADAPEPGTGHPLPPGDFEPAMADGIIDYVMECGERGLRQFTVEATEPCAVATGVVYGLGILFDAPERAERGPMGGMIHNYLQCAYDRWRGRRWRAERVSGGFLGAA